MYMPTLRVVTLVLSLVASYGAAAEDATPTPETAAPAPVQLPPWMSGDAVKAAVAINMTDAQQHDFNEAVGDYVTDHFAMIQKEAKREAPDLEQRVKSRDGALLHKLDNRLHKILTAQQWPAYEDYRKVLQKDLRTAPLPQQSGHTRAQPGVGGGRG
jgi:hypothetical protein